MDDTKRSDGSWDELAELLGLPPEKPAPPGPVAATPRAPVELKPAPAPIPEPPPPRVEEEHRPTFHVEQRAPAPPAAEEAIVGWEAEFEEEDDTPLDESEPRGEEIDEPDAEPGAPAPIAGEEDKPRRGRRRRRRGRRRGGDREEGEGPPKPAPADKGPAENAAPARPPRDADPRDRRGGRGDRDRGRPRDDDRRQRSGPPPRPPRAAPEPAEVDDFHDEPTPAVRSAISVEDTDFSNWSVPSWQDLIASLYRPDR